MQENEALNYLTFDPRPIPFQRRAMDDICRNYDYAIGTHEILFSGTVGSAKSVLGAHLAVDHCLSHNNACGCLVRYGLPDLRETIWQKILEQCQTPRVQKWLKRPPNSTSCKIEFKTGSKIISRTFADKVFTKPRSLELSFAIFEEAVELTDNYRQFYFEMLGRIGRIGHIKENWALLITNPDDPDHWLYDHFQLDLSEGCDKRDPRKHVYYSDLEQNPFLSDAYKKSIREIYDPLMYERMGKGRWLYLSTGGRVYYAFAPAKNLRKYAYKPNLDYPIWLSWDFNIAEGKPMSMVCFQLVEDEMHIFAEVVLHGIRTEDTCEELASRGLLDYDTNYCITGDAAGRARDTRNKRSDYDIIKAYLSAHRGIKFEMMQPLSNPTIRDRHTKVNAYCQNAAGRNRLFIYDGCPMSEKGMRLTSLKSGGNYIEDDSKEYQHVSAAIGYGLCSALKRVNRRRSRMVQH